MSSDSITKPGSNFPAVGKMRKYLHLIGSSGIRGNIRLIGLLSMSIFPKALKLTPVLVDPY